MTIQDRTRWDPRHEAQKAGEPRASVTRLAPAPAGALALDLACGQGRNTRALLAAGYRVVALDISLNALRHLRSLEAGGAARTLCVQADVDCWPLRPAAFDLVVLSDFLDRRLYSTLRAALRPGGQMLIDTFVDLGHPNAEGPSNPDHVLRPRELSRVFRDFEILEDSQQDGPTARALFRARKPANRR